VDHRLERVMKGSWLAQLVHAARPDDMRLRASMLLCFVLQSTSCFTGSVSGRGLVETCCMKFAMFMAEQI
jgi:hypothetical protein